jgi:2-polyprenyl-3-methyl-5-hydroxy-6-metoxy-1,4-benzoquinol methylase
MDLDCAVRTGKRCELVSLGSFFDRSETVGRIEVFQCVHCGHGITHPPIPDVAFLYGNRESQDYQPDTMNVLSRTIKEFAFRIQARKLIRQIGKPGKQALDFGCGSGQFTRVVGEMLPGTQLTGSDFYHAQPAELTGHLYVHNDVIMQQREKYDLVMAMHVLEHDDDVLGLLSKITAPAKHGATVVIEVPNVECFWSKVLGRFWDAWYVPYHRNHFSQRSLINLLENNELDVVRIHGVTVPTMGRTMANMFGRRNNLFWLLVGIALHPVQLIGETLSGQPTALRVIARKR